MRSRCSARADAIADLGRFDTIVDARSPGEFAEDRLPGAVNWPSLDDAERALVGTEYKQVSAVRRRGSAARRSSRATSPRTSSATWLDKPHDWTPLVYCWRGGKRSGALATVLDQIGFRVHVLEGGYRAFRRAVVAELETLPARFDWRVVCGPTGSGKSRLLARARRRKARRCSTSRRSPTTAARCSASCPAARSRRRRRSTRSSGTRCAGFDPARPVFVESESRKIGDLRVPEALIARDARVALRVARAAARGARRAADRGLRLLRRATSTRSAPGSTRCARCAAAPSSTRGSAGAQRPHGRRSCATCSTSTTTRSTCSRCGATSAASPRRSSSFAGTAATLRSRQPQPPPKRRRRNPDELHAPVGGFAAGNLAQRFLHVGAREWPHRRWHDRPFDLEGAC